MDIFHEYIVKKKIGAREIILSVLIAVIAAAIVFFSLPYMVFGLTAVADAAVIYFAYVLISRFNVEYEYILTNSSLDIDKIYAKRKRTRVLETDIKNFEICAPMGEKEFANDENTKVDSVKNFGTGNMADSYFAIFREEGKKVKLIFNPPEKMIESMMKFDVRKIHQR